MSRSKEPSSDRWWVVAALAAIFATGLVALIVAYPTSRFVWLAALFFCVFVWVFCRNPAHRYWRLATWLFGIAAALVVAPNVNAEFDALGWGHVKFVSETSFIGTIVFVLAGVVVLCLDPARKKKDEAPEPQLPLQEPGTVSITLTARQAIIVCPLVSADGTQAIAGPPIPGFDLATIVKTIQQKAPDHEIVRSLLVEIRSCRDRSEFKRASELIVTLEVQWHKERIGWPDDLRRAAALVLAENERSLFRSAAADGRTHDLTFLRQLIAELRNDLAN